MNCFSYYSFCSCGIDEKCCPHFIGLQCIDQQIVIDHHQRSIASKLFTSSHNYFCIRMHGSYIYIQKRTYSLQKYMHLIKPMIITLNVRSSSLWVYQESWFLLDRLDAFYLLLDHFSPTAKTMMLWQQRISCVMIMVTIFSIDYATMTLLLSIEELELQ